MQVFVNSLYLTNCFSDDFIKEKIKRNFKCLKKSVHGLVCHDLAVL